MAVEVFFLFYWRENKRIDERLLIIDIKYYFNLLKVDYCCSMTVIILPTAVHHCSDSVDIFGVSNEN